MRKFLYDLLKVQVAQGLTQANYPIAASASRIETDSKLDVLSHSRDGTPRALIEVKWRAGRQNARFLNGTGLEGSYRGSCRASSIA